jgi:hypothetical protein
MSGRRSIQTAPCRKLLRRVAAKECSPTRNRDSAQPKEGRRIPATKSYAPAGAGHLNKQFPRACGGVKKLPNVLDMRIPLLASSADRQAGVVFRWIQKENHPVCAAAKEATRHFISGRSHPSLR